jgi:HTH-type transcriptional regulator, transcriptional repressor of NAD biosynthesis genes
MKQTQQKTTGMVVGKFMPFHRGHELFLSFAHNFVDTLYIIVDNIDDGRYGDDYIQGKKRASWIEKRFPKAKVTYLKTPMPQDPADTEEFWPIWKKAITDCIGKKVDYVIVSEGYGYNLAKQLESVYVPFDAEREIVATSATAIRANLKDNWDMLASTSRSDYLMKFVMVGPESAGKTTLTKSLSEHYNTKAVPEYARMYLEAMCAPLGKQAQDLDLTEDDFFRIARGQVALEEAQSDLTNKFLFCDTDPLLTCVWFSWILKKEPPQELIDYAVNRECDVYFVLKPDLVWEKDTTRYDEMKDKGMDFFNDTILLLKKYKKKYVVIEGLERVESR